MVKVIAGFRDKVTRKIHTIGSEYTGERVEELTKAGFLKKTKSKPKKKSE